MGLLSTETWSKIMPETTIYHCQGKYCPGYSYPVPHPPTCADRRLTPRPAYHLGTLSFFGPAKMWAVRHGGNNIQLVVKGKQLSRFFPSRGEAVKQLLEAGLNVDFRGHVYEERVKT